jgi:hypothetical protein
LSPVINLHAPISIVTAVPYNELISATVGANFDILDCATNLTLDFYNTNQYTYNVTAYQKTFSKMGQFFAENPGGQSSTIVFENFQNQAMAAVPSDETSYAYRDARGYM